MISRSAHPLQFRVVQERADLDRGIARPPVCSQVATPALRHLDSLAAAGFPDAGRSSTVDDRSPCSACGAPPARTSRPTCSSALAAGVTLRSTPPSCALRGDGARLDRGHHAKLERGPTAPKRPEPARMGPGGMRHRVVVQAVAGSSPVAHPPGYFSRSWISRRQVATSPFRLSSRAVRSSKSRWTLSGCACSGLLPRGKPGGIRPAWEQVVSVEVEELHDHRVPGRPADRVE